MYALCHLVYYIWTPQNGLWMEEDVCRAQNEISELLNEVGTLKIWTITDNNFNKVEIAWFGERTK